jgi:hypothetical protein
VLAGRAREADLEWLMIDSTIVRAHQHAAGARKAKGGRMPRAWAGLDSNVVSPNDNSRTVPADRASGRLSAPSTTAHSKTAGCRCEGRAYPCVRPSIRSCAKAMSLRCPAVANQTDRIAETIASSMDFGAQTAANPLSRSH